MNATVKRIVELLFQDVEMTDEVKALEEEILNKIVRIGMKTKLRRAAVRMTP